MGCCLKKLKLQDSQNIIPVQINVTNYQQNVTKQELILITCQDQPKNLITDHETLKVQLKFQEQIFMTDLKEQFIQNSEDKYPKILVINQGTLKSNKQTKEQVFINNHKDYKNQKLGEILNLGIQNNGDQINLESQLFGSKDQSNINEQDIYCLSDLSVIQKKLIAPALYLWIDQNIHDSSLFNKVLQQLNCINIYPILCETIEQAKDALKNSENQNFRIISSAKLGEEVCKQFQHNKKIVHIYIFCGYKPAGQTLKKKWRKVKFYSINTSELLNNIEQQSNYDNSFMKLPNFMEITNKNNTYNTTLINKSRYNIYGLLLFKNRLQAKNDFVKLVKYIYSQKYPSKNKFKKQIQDFQLQYPVQYDHSKALSWYTRQTFFYGLLNNFLRSVTNPLQIPYIRLPFEATFMAIKSIYDQGNQQKSLLVYRGGYINENQLQYLQKNVGQYIQMFGFMSTSLKEEIAKTFIEKNDGNSLIEVIIQNQDRQRQIDYGYINLSKQNQHIEEQVLFNALNVYKIMSFKQQNGIYRIKLIYGQLARIVKLGQKNVEQKERNMILNHKHQQEIILNDLQNQGDVLKYNQMYHQEIEYRHKYINKKQGQYSIDIAIQLHKMGLGYKNKADYNKALQYYQRSLAIKIDIFDETHIITADTLNNIGIIYRKRAEYNLALQYYLKSLNIKMQVYGEINTSTADTENNIGLVYYDKKDYEKSLQYYQKALQTYINQLGENHMTTAATLNNIGTVYDVNANYSKALSYYQRALAIKINILGENHTSTADTLNNIGAVYQHNIKYNKALQYYQRSLSIYNLILSQQHCNTAVVFHNIGLLYVAQSKYLMALSYFTRCYQIRVKIFGTSHKFARQDLKNIQHCKMKLQLQQ